MSTPTPRTDAVYLQRGNWANEEELRDLARNLETELAALTTERDYWQKIAVSASREREHNANVAQAMTAECDQLRVERNNLRADLDAIKAILNEEKARAERAEDNLAALEQCHDDNCRGVVKIGDELATERAIVSRIWTQLGSPTYAQLKGRSIYDLIEELKADLTARLKRDYEYDHKCLYEVRERCESWKQRAERAEAELAKYLSACPASPTEEERKRCQQWWAVSGRSP